MEVKIGIYYIVADRGTHRGYTLIKKTKIRKRKGGDNKNAGKMKNVDLGYYTTFETAMQSLLDHKLRDSDVKTLDEVKELIWDLRHEIKKDYSLEIKKED